MFPTRADGQRKVSSRKWGIFPGGNGDGELAEDAQISGSRPTRWSMGILNDSRSHQVPGSVLLLSGHRNEPLGMRDAPSRNSTSSLPVAPTVLPPLRPNPSRRSSGAPKKKTKDGAIILEPQPDDSNHDPLNWPVWRREAALLSLGFYCMIGGGMTTILAAGFTNVSQDFGVGTEQVALTTGLYMMGLGLGSVFASPTAILFGKRPVYLASNILFILASVWCALSPNFPSLVAARIIQGISVSPVECLPSATIAEIFFLHERAFRIGIYTLLLLGGKNLVPLASAVVIQDLGWRWTFWVVAIIVGFFWILLFLFVPETFWDRTPHPKSRSGPRMFSFNRSKSRDEGGNSHRRSEGDDSRDANADVTGIAAVSIARDGSSQKEGEASRGRQGRNRPADHATVSFLQQLKPWNGRLHRDNWFRVLLRPFILFSYPAVLWSAAVYACSVGWLIVLSESVAIAYRSESTYNFTALQTGLVYLSPFIGGILGTAVAGKLSDLIVKAMARANGGLYEPEFRLVMGLPVALSTAIGLMGFGWSTQERDSWIVPTVFFGIISFGCTLGSTTAITFCVDSYRQYAGEALVTLNFSKNIFHGLVFSLFFNSWLEADGFKTVFIALGAIQLVVMLATIPMYIFGKRARMWTVRMNLMERF